MLTIIHLIVMLTKLNIRTINSNYSFSHSGYVLGVFKEKAKEHFSAAIGLSHGNHKMYC